MCNDKGFSLVEVLIGLAIFSVGALVGAMLITASLNQNEVAKERTRVSAVVSQRLEELRDRPWSASGGDVSLKAGGEILSDDDLRNYSHGSLDSEFGEEFDTTLDGAPESGSMAPFYLVMWRIEDMTDSGLDFKRITIRGVAMKQSLSGHNWLPVASFDHVAMIFREIKAE